MQNEQEISSYNQVILLEQYQTLQKTHCELQAKYEYLKLELAQLEQMIFGSKSERFIQADPGQLSLDLGIQQQAVQVVETEEVSYTRRKPSKEKESPVRMPLPSHLHREEHVIEPEEDLRGAKKIGEVITEILEYTPGRFYVKKISLKTGMV